MPLPWGLITASDWIAHAVHNFRVAWPTARRVLAGLIVAGWLALYGYWLASDAHPACQVTVTTETGAGAKTTITTRSCDLPSVSTYLYVLVPAALLLLPDMQRIRIGGVEVERRLSGLVSAAEVASSAAQGDVMEDSKEAPEVLGEILGGDS